MVASGDSSTPNWSFQRCGSERNSLIGRLCGVAAASPFEASSISTLIPARTIGQAALNPAGPLPTTITCGASVIAAPRLLPAAAEAPALRACHRRQGPAGGGRGRRGRGSATPQGEPP